MAPDMGRGGGYDYQWLLSYYLYTVMKEDGYILDKTKKYSGKEFYLFVSRIQRFKERCLNKYGNDFQFKVEILVEGEKDCLDDITFLSDSGLGDIDNVVFIQVKTKGGEEFETITTSEGIYKAIKNFLINLNFQRDKIKDNLSFFIFCNKDLSQPITDVINSKGPESYLRFIDYFCKKNSLEIYPSFVLKRLYKKTNRLLIIDILNGKDIYIDEYLKVYSKEYLEKLTCLIYDLRNIFINLDIIEKIDFDILESELLGYYDELEFYKNERRIRHLCWKGDEIDKGTPEFERYEKYKNTYFHPKDGGKLIHEINVITKGKFI